MIRKNLQLELAATLQKKEKEYDKVLSKWKKNIPDAKENLGDDREKW